MENIGVEKHKVLLVSHHKSWRDYYNQESKILFETMKNDIIDIQHVGSTVIPELTSKPIIDILVGLKKLELGEKYITTLQEMGYQYKGHMGNSNRFFFSKYYSNKNTYNLHLTKFKDHNWNRMTKFRDLLKNDEQIRVAYNTLKLELSKKFQNYRNKYTEEKAAFIEKSLKEKN